MFLMGVYSLILKQAQEMKTALVRPPIVNELFPVFDLKKLAGAQAVINALEFLDYDPPGSHVEVAHFG
jgi:hypothetical protein